MKKFVFKILLSLIVIFGFFYQVSPLHAFFPCILENCFPDAEVAPAREAGPNAQTLEDLIPVDLESLDNKAKNEVCNGEFLPYFAKDRLRCEIALTNCELRYKKCIRDTCRVEKDSHGVITSYNCWPSQMDQCHDDGWNDMRTSVYMDCLPPSSWDEPINQPIFYMPSFGQLQ